MWRPWSSKSTVRIHNTSSPSTAFSCSSFKDIQHLCTEDPSASNPCSSTAKRPSNIFHRVRVANSLIRAWSSLPSVVSESKSGPQNASPVINKTPQPEPRIAIPGADKRIVVYFTSLRVVRTTFEDCRSVRSILRGFRVSIDERDLSMDSRFLNELQEILGGEGKLTLPRVFIGGEYMGGAEEIRQLHEAGELKKFVEGLPAAELGICELCGGYGFVPCDECNGSHKLYAEKTGFKSCTACNENGLTRCPSCSCPPI
ncbi:uncharacterized protein At5g39865 [Tripterygium wilfordii]|uniref:uncharacterized protein At5g39865 n=1 Tax=Tripterygium wilfordii TaxID=458696 RepID=UPI0018F858C5|nr:uncharacterized protein At5g39865 [Tripterygium wilfordii]